MSKIPVEIDYILMAQYMNNLAFYFREIKKETNNEKILGLIENGDLVLGKMCDSFDRAINKDGLKEQRRM